MAAGLGALLPATASSGEEKPTARMEDADRRSRNDFSFGYAMTRRSGPVSVRIPAITAYCTPKESTNSFTTASSVTLPAVPYTFPSSKRSSKLACRSKSVMNETEANLRGREEWSRHERNDAPRRTACPQKDIISSQNGCTKEWRRQAGARKK